jgi:hypothetical protein
VANKHHFLRYDRIIYRVSQKWRTNYLLPYRGCLNVHEKNVSDKKINSYPTSTRRHGNFAGVHTLLRILLSSNSAVLINIITSVSPPHFDFVVFYYVLCQCKEIYIHTSLPCNVTVEDLK